MDLRRNRKVGRLVLRLVLLLLMLRVTLPAFADDDLPEVLEQARFDQQLGETVPLDLRFHNEQGKIVQLSEYIGDKPVILSLNYFECPNLCPILLDGLLEGMKGLPFTIGEEFEVVTVSINPRETPPLAAATQARYIARYERGDVAEGWHFLTGDEQTIEQLAEAVGFNYAYDTEQQQYAHPSGVIVLTPQARIARYIYGIEFPSRDLRLALVEASENKIGSPVDQVLLFCYRYDPVEGRYTAIAINSMRLGGLVTVLGMGAFLGLMSWQALRKKDSQAGAE